MRDFILSDITGGNKAPFSKRSLEHLNEMSSELGESLFNGIANETSISEFIILTGCEITGSQPGVISYTAGEIFYQGNIYKVDANASLTINIGEVATWAYDDSYITGDPATYSDTNTYNFHRIRKMKLVSATTGSNIIDYNDVKLYHKFQQGGFLGTSIAVTPNITAINTSTNRLIREGKFVFVALQIEVTLSSPTDEIHISFPLSDPENYPIQSSVAYPAGNKGFGSVANQLGLSMPLCSGYIVVDSVNNQLDVKWTCVSSESTHQVLANVCYIADKAYSPY